MVFTALPQISSHAPIPTPLSSFFLSPVIDFDWSNGKAIWAKQQPMMDEELLFEQVKMSVAASPNSEIWIYRCSVYAYRESSSTSKYIHRSLREQKHSSLNRSVYNHTPTSPSHPFLAAWYSSVRAILEDPAYESWFIKFKPQGPWFSPKCDTNWSPAKCSDYYHVRSFQG